MKGKESCLGYWGFAVHALDVSSRGLIFAGRQHAVPDGQKILHLPALKRLWRNLRVPGSLLRCKQQDENEFLP